MSDFRKLSVYDKALSFVSDIYRATKKFPNEERFGLTTQLRRAAISICANIAEGSGRFHKKDFAQFLRISLGSASECEAMLDIAKQLSFIDEKEYDDLIRQCSEIGRMLSGLIKSIAGN